MVTAGNASGVVDGAAAVMVTSATRSEGGGQDSRSASCARWAAVGVDPAIMGFGPAPAIRKALERAGIKLDQIDLFEINEAFAGQYLAVEKDLGLDREKVNVNGGAIGLGHPLGATGTRLIYTLLIELGKRGKRFGIASRVHRRRPGHGGAARTRLGEPGSSSRDLILSGRLQAPLPPGGPHGRPRSDLRLERRRRALGEAAVPRPARRRDAARRPAVALGAVPGDRAEARDPAPDGAPLRSTPRTSACRARARTWCATRCGWPRRSYAPSSRIRANCAARTLRQDITPVVEISQKAGLPIEVCTFIGSSPIRQFAENWTLEMMLQHTEDAVTYAVSNGLPVMYVTEDTVRAQPAHAAPAVPVPRFALARNGCACATPSAMPRRPVPRTWCASRSRWCARAAPKSSWTGTATAIAGSR